MEGALGQWYQAAGFDKALSPGFLLLLHLPTLLPPYQSSSRPLNIFSQAITALSSPRNGLVPDLEVTSSLSSSQIQLTCHLLRPPSQTTQSKATSRHYPHPTPPLSLFLFYFLPLWNVFLCYCCVGPGYRGSSLRAGLPCLPC